MDQEYLEYLRGLLGKAGSKISDNLKEAKDNTLTSAQADFKQLKDSDYQPSEDELAAKQAFEAQNLGLATGTLGAAPKFGALASKLAPQVKSAQAIKDATPIVGDTLAKELAAKTMSDQIAEHAIAGAEQGLLGAPTQADLVKAVALRNRQMDFAQRSNNAYQAKMDSIRKLQGK